MIVLKFGGTSVGSVENFRKVAKNCSEQQWREDSCVICDVWCYQYAGSNCGIIEVQKPKDALELINELNEKYLVVAREL